MKLNLVIWELENMCVTTLLIKVPDVSIVKFKSTQTRAIRFDYAWREVIKINCVSPGGELSRIWFIL